MWGPSAYNICCPIGPQSWFGGSDWLGSCPLASSPLHVLPSWSCQLVLPQFLWTGEVTCAVQGLWAAVLPCWGSRQAQNIGQSIQKKSLSNMPFPCWFFFVSLSSPELFRTKIFCTQPLYFGNNVYFRNWTLEATCKLCHCQVFKLSNSWYFFSLIYLLCVPKLLCIA